MHEFKVGNLVELVNLQYPSGHKFVPNKANTLGNKGTIYAISANPLEVCPIIVHWDNGSVNWYFSGNLKLLSDNQEFRDE